MMKIIYIGIAFVTLTLLSSFARAGEVSGEKSVRTEVLSAPPPKKSLSPKIKEMMAQADALAKLESTAKYYDYAKSMLSSFNEKFHEEGWEAEDLAAILWIGYSVANAPFERVDLKERPENRVKYKSEDLWVKNMYAEFLEKVVSFQFKNWEGKELPVSRREATGLVSEYVARMLLNIKNLECSKYTKEEWIEKIEAAKKSIQDEIAKEEDQVRSEMRKELFDQESEETIKEAEAYFVLSAKKEDKELSEEERDKVEKELIKFSEGMQEETRLLIFNKLFKMGNYVSAKQHLKFNIYQSKTGYLKNRKTDFGIRVESMEEILVELLLQNYPQQGTEIKKYLKMAGYTTNQEIWELLDRTAGRNSKTEFLYKGRKEEKKKK